MEATERRGFTRWLHEKQGRELAATHTAGPLALQATLRTRHEEPSLREGKHWLDTVKACLTA